MYVVHEEELVVQLLLVFSVEDHRSIHRENCRKQMSRCFVGDYYRNWSVDLGKKKHTKQSFVVRWTNRSSTRTIRRRNVGITFRRTMFIGLTGCSTVTIEWTRWNHKQTRNTRMTTPSMCWSTSRLEYIRWQRQEILFDGILQRFVVRNRLVQFVLSN